MDTQDMRTLQCPPGFDFSIYMAVYMHVTDVNVQTWWYSKRINTTLTCIPQMIIWLCEVHVYMHLAFKELRNTIYMGIQTIHVKQLPVCCNSSTPWYETSDHASTGIKSGSGEYFVTDGRAIIKFSHETCNLHTVRRCVKLCGW